VGAGEVDMKDEEAESFRWEKFSKAGNARAFQKRGHFPVILEYNTLPVMAGRP
jgi:hypothetical protein